MHVVFESGPLRRLTARLTAWAKYRVMRPAVSAGLYLMRGEAEDERLGVDGQALRSGITYCLVAKNEESTLPLCLASLPGLVDQVVCLDNGSTDRTLEEMKRFAAAHPELDVTVESRPSGTLCELRQEAARRVRRTWFFRGDADMVFLDALRRLRPALLEMQRPAAVLCRKIELFGDSLHYNRLFGPVSEGEYFLRRFDRQLRYTEYEGRLEHAPLPIHYRMIRPSALAMLHLDSHKPNERLIYRTCYLDWRQHVNRTAGSPPVAFEEYRRRWLRHNFDTDDAMAQRFRMARLMGEQAARLPDGLRAVVREVLPVAAEERFVVEYRGERPYLRRDRHDVELSEYHATPADLAWPADPARFYRDSVRMGFTVGG